ncbi:PD-(D/E)XK nuclease family protein [Methylovulum psychrotolerans]|uniref:PD-(D/E)XK endonuclease-like domain-containing protein n=1 Tax=Methylovulum psychrotolerans TaxID=1704499 RepID=A0A1Z4BYN0_9GAMM|nr:PD-(D/E)XK nuclease family protein [Methylovulum psychrotolerans]ASF46396.1 hypothetical protein CEK71_10095 [Methylovulum psychrotolerans]
MQIRFGFGLDGIKPKRTHTAIGEKEVGPIGFLSVLETQCGIAPVTDSLATRIIQYLGCLKACDTPDRFYHLSLATDQFNVAKTLLQWRDGWYESGWDGLFSSGVSGRLADMAAVEQLAAKKVSLGFGQRQQTILAMLKTQKTQIERVVLLDRPSDFSPLWRQILQSFDVTEQPALLPAAPLGKDLHRLQSTLAQLAAESLNKGEDGSVHKTKLVGDHSFVVVKARSKAISARLISQWLASQAPNNSDKTVAVLTGGDGVAMDDALSAVHLPRLGFEKASPWRPILQVLPVALELLWEPLNPDMLLQFLMQPVGLLPGRIRHPLAKVVANAPGIGGEQWRQTLTDLLEAEKNREDYSDGRFKQLQADLAYWFAAPRYTPKAGLPLDIAKQRTLKVASWLEQQQPRWEDEAMRALLGAAYGQASELNAALSNLLADGTTHIQPEQLRYLLDQLTGSGIGIVDQYAECVSGQPQWLVGARQPDSFNQTVNTLVWWDFRALPLQSAYPWSRQERQQLNRHGVLLPDLDRQLQRQALSWLKPINAASERLIIVLHEDEEAYHPLWDQICSCLENWQEIKAEDSVLRGDPIRVFDSLTPVKADDKPLVGLSRWWRLGAGEGLAPREQESYSSLEAFFYSPYQWVLRYKAGLTAGMLQSLGDGNLLKGNLAHHLYERYFIENGGLLTSETADRAALNNWFDQVIHTLLAEEGAVLLQPGRLAEKEQFIDTARKSLYELIRQLKTANVVHIEMEQAQEAPFFGGNLRGSIDMKVTNADGKEAVVDIKWGGAKYHKDSLQGNTHLQLVTYSYMRQKNSAAKQWPAVAYFVIKDGGAMLAQNTDYFPEAIAIKPDTDESHAVIWRKMQTTWEWRRKQLDRGLIEVSVSGTEAAADSDPGEAALTIPKASDAFNDYKVLTGWGEWR